MSISKKHMRDMGLCNRIVSTYLTAEKPTMEAVAVMMGTTFHTTAAVLKRDLTTEGLQMEKALRDSRKGKRGSEHYLFGKTREQHHNYKGVIEDGHGYLQMLKPEWYTGRVGSKYVFQHHVVMCKAMSITEIPKGFSVHHINGDKTNNVMENLALVSDVGHRKIHHYSPISEKLSMWDLHEFMIWKLKESTAS